MEQPRSSYGVLDNERQMIIYEALLPSLVDDVITLVGEYAQERQIMFLTGETRYAEGDYNYHGSKNVTIYETTSSTWRKCQLSQPIHCDTSIQSYIDKNELVIFRQIELDDVFSGPWSYTTLNLVTGKVVIKQKNLNTLTSIPSFTSSSFKGLCHFTCYSSGGEKISCSLDYLQKQYYKIDTLIFYDPARFIYSPMHSRLFNSKRIGNEFYEIIAPTFIFEKRAPPPFRWFYQTCYTMTENEIYVFIHKTCYCYHMKTDRWTQLPDNHNPLAVSRACSCIVYNELFVCFTSFIDGSSCLCSYNLDQSDDDGRWKYISKMPAFPEDGSAGYVGMVCI